MHLLITNDDGIDAPGIQLLAEVLREKHRVTIVAPSANMSGASQSITVVRPVVVRKRGDQAWAVDGTPADCVRIGALRLCDDKPDLIVSGINLGANLGTDIIYSGTAGAARQGTFMGFPAIAASVFDYEKPEDLSLCARFVASSLTLLSALLAENTIPAYININVPVKASGVVISARPGDMNYETEIEQFPPEPGDEEGVLRLKPRARLLAPRFDGAEDLLAVQDGAITLTGMGSFGVDEQLHSALGQRIGDLQGMADSLLG